jgi:hypothetical protein
MENEQALKYAILKVIGNQGDEPYGYVINTYPTEKEAQENMSAIAAERGGSYMIKALYKWEQNY